MKAIDLIDAAGAQILRFDWLLEAVAPVSPYGSRCFAALRPFFAGDEVRARERADAIVATADALDRETLDTVRALLRQMPDVESPVARASMGDILDDPDFLELSRFCTALERIDERLAPTLLRAPVASNAVREVGKALAVGNQHDLGFYLADAYGDELARARERLIRA